MCASCQLWERSTKSLWFCFANSLRQLPSLPRAFVLHVMRHFSKLLEVLETLLHGRKMKATNPEVPALCRGDWKSLVPALTNSPYCTGWADCPRTLYWLQENRLLPDKRSMLKCHRFWHASPLSVHPVVLFNRLLPKSSLVLKTFYGIIPSVLIWIQMLCFKWPCRHQIAFVLLIWKTIAVRRCK